MHASDSFIDTNILLYLLSSDSYKAERTEDIMKTGGLISVQVLNEIVNVTHRKLDMPWPEVNELISLVKSICKVKSLGIETHDMGRHISERYTLSIYDSMIIAAALLADCKTLYSEDMQNGMIIGDHLVIRNPFQN